MDLIPAARARLIKGMLPGLCALVVTAASPGAAAAQQVEITPFGGYRAGGSIAEIGGTPVVDDHGGPSAGVIVDVVFGPQNDGLKVEGVFSREEAQVQVRRSLFDPPTLVLVNVDQVQVGGIRDLSDGRVRPFLAGLFGLTRYAAPGDTEVLFSVGAGTGVKFSASRHVGLRLDARGYLTIVSLAASGVCGGYGCAIRFNVAPAFQADFTAGLMIGF